MSEKPLSKEDYEEPCCPLKTPKNCVSIPTGRVISKLDEYLGKKDYPSAERHLKYWLEEAKAGNDTRGELTVLNEQIGLYRKTDKKAEGLEAIRSALLLVDCMQMQNSVTLGTTYINAATAYKAFGMAEEALPLYEKAQKIYESQLDNTDDRLAGLYNNMALTVMSLGDYSKAKDLFFKAIDIMHRQENGQAEEAITYVNLCDLVSAEKGLEEGEKQIAEYLDKAEELLNTESLPHDGNYAFVCEKCAPVFGYYGYFLTEQELMKRAREIYERS